MRDGKNILQHEFIGLTVRVMGSRCENHPGLSGTVIDETMNMLIIDTGKKIMKIPKTGSVFSFELSDGTVTVDGDTIGIRSEDRTKRLGKPKVLRRFKEFQRDYRSMTKDQDNDQ